MSTPIITAHRNLAQRISKLLLKGGEIDLTPWQLRQVQRALLDLYEPDGYVAKELIERQRLVDQLTAVVAATSRHLQGMHCSAAACCTVCFQ
jgi:hypothetical protein